MIKSTAMLGLHGLGGRMGTRIIDPQPLIFDHAAQFFTVSDPQFAKLVDGWSEKGQVQQWEGTIGELEVGGRFVPLPSSPPRYIGVNGMRPLADSILSQTCMIDVVRPCWISKLEPCNGMWHLSENGKPRGQFDALVIAHNVLAKQRAQEIAAPHSSIPVSHGDQGTSKKVDIPNGRVGVIIGKAGETIKYLQLQSGAKIQVTRDMDADPNSRTRMVELND
ncbi:unnamed protein product [Camellia sinensis]